MIIDSVMIEENRKNYWNLWILSGVVSLGILCMVFFVIEPVFMTIDDARLMYVYAGYMTGTPAPNYLFSYYPLGWIVSKLYNIAPGVSWYAIYHFMVVGLSTTILGKVIYSLKKKKKISIGMLILVHIFTYAIFYLISTILVHFEITAAFAGTAGMILFLSMDVENSSIKKIIFESIISLIFLMLCFIQQFNAFYAVCCYVIVAVSYLLLQAIFAKKYKKTIIYLSIYLLFFSISTLGMKCFENHMKSTLEWQEYREYNKYRVSFWDYAHESYSDNPSKFEENSWSKEFYEITEDMYFMDKRFNKDTLENLFNRFSWKSMDDIGEFNNNWENSLLELFRADKVTVLQLYILIMFSIAILFMVFRQKCWGICREEVISLVCCLGGTFIVLSFLAGRGRLPLRAWLACIYPCSAVVIVLLIKMVCKLPGITLTRRSIFGGIFLIPALVLFAQSYQKIYHIDWMYRQNSISFVDSVEKYAMGHPENVYIYDTFGAQNYGVFTNYGDSEEKPINLFPWGSSYVYTPVYYEQLKANRKEVLLTENLYDDNVYYITSSSDEFYKNELLDMLNSDYYPSKAEIVDVVDSIIVYKFIKE